MKFSFTPIDNGMLIEVSHNIASIPSIKKTISFDDNESYQKTIKDMIDNLRLTVKERENALVDLNELKEYLCNFKDEPNKEIMINE